MLSNIDPIYRMKVNFSARLVPGLAAMELTVFCYNRRDFRRPYMFWVNASTPVTEGTRFVYPMTRTIGHTTAEVADWPYYNGVDYSWIKNNSHMLGVFGIDIYDNFLGSNPAIAALFGVKLNFFHGAAASALLAAVVHVVVSLCTRPDDEKSAYTWTQLGGHDPSVLKKTM